MINWFNNFKKIMAKKNKKMKDNQMEINETVENKTVDTDNNVNSNLSDSSESNDQKSGNMTAENENLSDGSKEKDPIKELSENYNILNDKYVRLVAEYDNYRKRTLKEKMDIMKTAGEDILVNILPVVDNFERGMKAMETAKDIDAVKEGINLIYIKFKEFLTQRGVKEIEALEQELNTDLHDAITKIPAPNEGLKGKVVDVVEKGYMLKDKVIRFAKVVVGE